MSDTNSEQAQEQPQVIAQMSANMFSTGQIHVSIPDDLKLAMSLMTALTKFIAQRIVQEDWAPKTQGGKIIIPQLDTRGLDLGGN